MSAQLSTSADRPSKGLGANNNKTVKSMGYVNHGKSNIASKHSRKHEACPPWGKRVASRLKQFLVLYGLNKNVF